jgi:hypothetical protein
MKSTKKNGHQILRERKETNQTDEEKIGPASPEQENQRGKRKSSASNKNQERTT